jgi:hypothetical protein
MDGMEEMKGWWKRLSWPVAVYRAGLAAPLHRSHDGHRSVQDRLSERMLTRSFAPRASARPAQSNGAPELGPALHPYSWLVATSRVNGTPIFDKAGHPAGHISDLSVDKNSGQVIYALVAIGGGVGQPEVFYPLPWWLLHYERHKQGYVTPAPLSTIEAGPCLMREEIEWFGADDSAWRERLAIYYSPYAPSQA